MLLPFLHSNHVPSHMTSKMENSSPQHIQQSRFPRIFPHTQMLPCTTDDLCNARLGVLPDLGGVPWSLVEEAVLLLSWAARSATCRHYQGRIRKCHNNDQPAIQGRSCSGNASALQLRKN